MSLVHLSVEPSGAGALAEEGGDPADEAASLAKDSLQCSTADLQGQLSDLVDGEVDYALNVRPWLRVLCVPLVPVNVLMFVITLPLVVGNIKMGQPGDAARQMAFGFGFCFSAWALLSPIYAVLEMLQFMFTYRSTFPLPEMTGFWLVVTEVVYTLNLGYSLRVYMVMCGVFLLSSVVMDTALHYLADQVSVAGCWQELKPVVQRHQELTRALRDFHQLLAADMSVIVTTLLLVLVLSVFRCVIGHQDAFVVFVFGALAYVSLLCLAADLQCEAGKALYAAVCSLPWDEWPVEDRRCVAVLITIYSRPSQVRLQLLGDMDLERLSHILRAVYNYTQLLRAGITSKEM